MTNLSTVWGQVKSLLEDNISLIPVRDKNEGDKVAKSPYGSWLKYQTESMTEGELWHAMEERDTTAIGIVCGKISGNIEVIDVDVKYKNGIDAILLKDIQSFYPHIFEKLRIHGSPSGGLHIIYRVDRNHPVPGSQKLAGRYSTEDEIAEQIKRGVKKPNKEVNFLETKAEGGYVLGPPSMGYTVTKDNPIPILTWEERCSLITLCETYSEIIKVVPTPRPSKNQDSIYDENPFEHFNASADPVQLLQEFGWKFSHENHTFIWFTRPDKAKGVSASWNKVKQVFYIFTNSTELQGNKGYLPASVLAELKFDGDKSKTFHWLTANGFGKVKAKVEASIVKKSLLSGQGIPENFSEDAKATFASAKVAIQEDHPYGTFIKYDEDLEKLSVSYENLIYVSSRLGLFNYRDNVIHIKGKIIEMITHRQFQDSLKDYIKEEEADDYEKLCNVFEKFMKENTKYVTTRLNILPDEEARFVRDNKDNTYIFYLNGFVDVSSLGIELKDYDDLDGYIWNTQILNRNFIYSDNSDCDFKNFVHNVSGKDSKRYISITSALGYLMNDYKDPSYSPAVILNDEVISDHPEGGTGKGLLINALKYFKKSVSFDGKTFSFDKSFVYQKINLDTKIMAFDDVNKNFDFEKLFSVISEGIDVEKKNRDAFKIPFEDSPKITITTNYAMSGQGNSNDRRRFELELARHYSKEHTPFDEFGKLLFTGWDDKEWNAFDNFMAECAMHYILQGLVQQELIHLPEKKLIAQTSSTFIDFINDWLEDHNNNPFGQISRIIMYNEFMHENQKSKLTSNSFYKWCRIFFEFKKINFEEKRGAGGDRQFLFI